MIHGLRPGPLLFQDNLSLIYALFIGIMLSSIFLFLIGKASIRIISKIADIPHRVLFPIVLILCVFGSYAVNNNIFDVGVMFLMGFVGFLMLKLKIPAAPFLIAFILYLISRITSSVTSVIPRRFAGVFLQPNLLAILGAYCAGCFYYCPQGRDIRQLGIQGMNAQLSQEKLIRLLPGMAQNCKDSQRLGPMF